MTENNSQGVKSVRDGERQNPLSKKNEIIAVTENMQHKRKKIITISAERQDKGAGENTPIPWYTMVFLVSRISTSSDARTFLPIFLPSRLVYVPWVVWRDWMLRRGKRIKAGVASGESVCPQSFNMDSTGKLKVSKDYVKRPHSKMSLSAPNSWIPNFNV